MKVTLLVTLIAAALASSSAFADGADYEQPRAATSTVSRGEIRAALAAARAKDALPSGERSYVAPVTGQPVSRSEVSAQLEVARANQEVSSGELGFVPEAHASVNRTKSARSAGERASH